MLKILYNFLTIFFNYLWSSCLILFKWYSQLSIMFAEPSLSECGSIYQNFYLNLKNMYDIKFKWAVSNFQKFYLILILID